jgi:selenocysteine-specific elongation factor
VSQSAAARGAADVSEPRQHVVATAGHVDHGKSALVRALTGMEPDRYAEEQRRGMTIDLGFVWTTLDLPVPATGERPPPTSGGDGGRARVAFVDVPGHERFVSTMLAGVGPVPAVLFVVAADEGWMPQSSEHLQALDALGVRHGVVAVTRCDLADPRAAVASVRERLAPTSLRGSPVAAVSAVTGAGLDQLRAELGRLVAGLAVPDRAGDVRVWVDRSFTVAGAGTVVTGTLPGGSIRVGDELDLHTAGTSRRVVVRGLQSLGEGHRSVTGVARVAVNLRGIRHDEVRRGDALVTPSTVTRTDLVDVRVHLAGAASGEGSVIRDLAAQCLAHLGSAQVTASVRPLGGDTVRVRLSHPLPLRLGDRLLLRDPGRHLVIGSSVVLDPSPPSLRRRGDARRRAAGLTEISDEPDVAAQLRLRGPVTVTALRALGCSAGAVDAVPALRADGGWLVDPDMARSLSTVLRAAVDEHARDRPLEPGLPLEQARYLLDLPDVHIVHALVGSPRTAGAGVPGMADGCVGLQVRDGRVTDLARTDDQLPAPVTQSVQALRDDLRAHPFLAPEAARLVELGLDRQALAAAVRAQQLARVGGDVYLMPGWVEEATRLLSRLDQPFTVSQARRALDTTRRVAVPLLERLDAERVTARLPDDRRVVRPREAD